jgi:outer membrane protein
VLFNGFQNLNTIKQNKTNTQAKQLDLQQSENDLKIEVISAFLQVLYAKEFLLVSKNQLALSGQQLERVKKLLDAGSVAKGNLLEVEAQYAMEELQVVNAQNQLDLSYLKLSQTMNLEQRPDFEVEQPEIVIKAEQLVLEPVSDIYAYALSNQPSVKSAELGVLNQQHGLAAAKGAMSPRLVLNASYGSGYSQLRKQPFGTPGFVGYDTVGITVSNDAVLIPRYQMDYRVTPFSAQFKDNVNKTIGLSLNIPIFNGLAVHHKINQAKIAYESSKLNLEQSKQAIRNIIQQAHADANAAFRKYKACETALNSLQQAYGYNEQKFELGLLNTFLFNDSKNKMIKAQADLLQAKFDYLFKLKILDYYLGKPLKL